MANKNYSHFKKTSAEPNIDGIIESVLTSRVDGSKLTLDDISPDIKLPPRKEEPSSDRPSFASGSSQNPKNKKNRSRQSYGSYGKEKNRQSEEGIADRDDSLSAPDPASDENKSGNQNQKNAQNAKGAPNRKNAKNEQNAKNAKNAQNAKNGKGAQDEPSGKGTQNTKNGKNAQNAQGAQKTDGASSSSDAQQRGKSKNRHSGKQPSVTNLSSVANQAAAAPIVSTPVNPAEKSTVSSKGRGKKLRVIPLGGLGEIGKNMTALEYSDNILIIDCGIGFPDDAMPGIDAVIPDFSYLISNREKIKGVVITHGHEDHLGAVPYLLEKLDVPVFATRLTLGILEKKLEEHTLPFKPQYNCVSAGEKVRIGYFEVEFIPVNHSIADAVCLAIRTPVGIVFHSGDFKIDATPVDGEMTDLTRIGEIGREGVALLMCESTNVERPGFTPSEKKVGQSLVRYFEEYKDKRIIISTFSSNVHRVQQIIDIAAKYGRKVAITGRSMLNVIGAAIKLGYMNVPSGVIVDISTIRNYPPEKMTVVSTGSQGEPMSALHRMAYGMHDKVELGPYDLVIISASAIPGNERLVGNIINELYRRGVQVLTDTTAEVHVSGHACQEEIKILHALTKPKYFMPVHGEARHLYQHKTLAENMGMSPENIFVTCELGRVLEIGTEGAKWNGTVPSGVVLVDGSGVGDVGNVVLRDRRLLSQDGLIVVCLSVDRELGDLASRAEVTTRGFIYVKESEDMLEEIRLIAEDTARESLSKNVKDYSTLKNRIKDEVTRFVFAKTKRKPVILPVIV